MSHGFVTWYTGRHESHTTEALFGRFEERGLHLRHPENGRITLLVREGDQLAVEREELLSRLTQMQSGDRVTFQFWLYDSADVVTSQWQLETDLVAQWFWLDGLDADEREFVISLIVSQIGRRDVRTYGLVIDRPGDSENFDWHELMRMRAKRTLDVRCDLFLGP